MINLNIKFLYTSGQPKFVLNKNVCYIEHNPYCPKRKTCLYEYSLNLTFSSTTLNRNYYSLEKSVNFVLFVCIFSSVGLLIQEILMVLNGIRVAVPNWQIMYHFIVVLVLEQMEPPTMVIENDMPQNNIVLVAVLVISVIMVLFLCYQLLHIKVYH